MESRAIDSVAFREAQHEHWDSAAVTIRLPGITPSTDLVERDLSPSSPNVLWVADIGSGPVGERRPVSRGVAD